MGFFVFVYNAIMSLEAGRNWSSHHQAVRAANKPQQLSDNTVFFDQQEQSNLCISLDPLEGSNDFLVFLFKHLHKYS